MNAALSALGTSSPMTPLTRALAAPAADSAAPGPGPVGDGGSFTRALQAARQADRGHERQLARQAEGQAQARARHEARQRAETTGPGAPESDVAGAEAEAAASKRRPGVETPSDEVAAPAQPPSAASLPPAATGAGRQPGEQPGDHPGEQLGIKAQGPGSSSPAMGVASDAAAGQASGDELQAQAGQRGGPFEAGDASPLSAGPAAAARGARGMANAAGVALRPSQAGNEPSAGGRRNGPGAPAEAAGLPSAASAGLMSHNMNGTNGVAGTAGAAGAAPPLATGSPSFAPWLALQPSLPPAAPAEAALPAAPGSPQFAPQLSAQISTFVRQGVELARLHLNPAELGPVELRIRIEGDQAQVLMAADLPITRASLEQAMPTLAAGLREAGLTLAGGGVFDTASGALGQAFAEAGNGGRGSESGEARPRSGQAPGADGASRSALHDSPARAVPQHRGLVDLVA